MKHLNRTLALAALLLGIASVAQADVPPPDLCGEVGSSCRTDDGREGVCTEATCTRPDYSMGTPPTYNEYPCNRCRPRSSATSAEQVPSDEPGDVEVQSQAGAAEAVVSCSSGGALAGLGPLAFVALAWSVFLLRRRR